MSAENQQKLVASLQAFAGTTFDTGSTGMDTEVADTLWDIESILQQSGWMQIDFIGVAGGLQMKRNLRPMAGWVVGSKVTVEIDPQHRGALLTAADALISGLTAIGIEAREQAPPLNISSNVSALHVFVGSKI